MKNALIFLLIGGILGAFALHLYNQREAAERTAPAAAGASPSEEKAPENSASSEKSPDTSGVEPKDAISRKLAEWHLTPDDIRNDLAKTGEVVRTKAQEVGEKIDDARIVTVIKAKFVLDRDLSALDISVESNHGDVTLGGTVAAPGLIGKAIILSLDTEGVHSVDSKLRVATR